MIGAGPAGMSAALQARELGAETTLLEADEVGGTSLHRGPAPVRTLARAARLARDWTSWTHFGLVGQRPEPDLRALLFRSAEVAQYARDKKRMAPHLRRHGIDLVEHIGPTRFVDSHTVTVDDGRTWTAHRIIVAVGGHATRLPVPGAELALTYNDIPSLTELPGSAAIVGGADTGCQIASILADFGVAVSIFEIGPALIGSADESVSDGLADAFRSRGLEVNTNCAVTELRRSNGQLTIDYASGDETGSASYDAVFMAVGWPANIHGLELSNAGVESTRDAIPVDDFLRTNIDDIFAAGDVNGHIKLVQVARAEGRTAAINAVSGPVQRVSYDVVPAGSFTDPEYGQVGLTEAAARQTHDVVAAVALYEELLRPVADGRADGFCKLIADRQSRQILGAHVLGDYSAEIIQVVAAIMAAGMTVEQVATLQFAFPTFTEAVGMAAQMICRDLDVGRFPQVWSDLSHKHGEHGPKF